MALSNIEISGNMDLTQAPVKLIAGAAGAASMNIPSGNAPTTPNAGDFWNDSTQLNLGFSFNGGSGVKSFPLMIPVGCAIPAQAANTTITTIQVMGTIPLGTGAGAGAMNAVGKTLRVKGAGIYTTAGAQTPQITITLILGGVTIVAVQSAATTASATNMPFNFDFEIQVISVGASGTVECHGTLNLTLGTTPAAASSVFLDTNTAVSAAINLTAANALTINITATSTLNSATLRQASAWLGN